MENQSRAQAAAVCQGRMRAPTMCVQERGGKGHGGGGERLLGEGSAKKLQIYVSKALHLLSDGEVEIVPYFSRLKFHLFCRISAGELFLSFIMN